MLIGGGHASTSRVGAFAGGGISIYNVNPAITVPQTSMLNFVDSNGPPPIGYEISMYVLSSLVDLQYKIST